MSWGKMWKLRNGRPKDGHVLHQRLKINKNWHIGFRFSQILVLTVFLLLFFFRRPFWIEDRNRKRWFAIPYKTISEEQNVSIWRKLHTNWRSKSSAFETFKAKPLWRHWSNIFKIREKRIRYVMFNEKKMHKQLINCFLMTAVLYVYCRTRLGGRLSKHDDAGYLSRIK